MSWLLVQLRNVFVCVCFIIWLHFLYLGNLWIFPSWHWQGWEWEPTPTQRQCPCYPYLALPSSQIPASLPTRNPLKPLISFYHSGRPLSFHLELYSPIHFLYPFGYLIVAISLSIWCSSVQTRPLTICFI